MNQRKSNGMVPPRNTNESYNNDKCQKSAVIPKQPWETHCDVKVSRNQPLPAPDKSIKSFSGIERGTVGKGGIVETNYVTLDLHNMPNIAFHYDLTVTPVYPKKFYRDAFKQFNRQYFKGTAMAFDGQKSFYTVEKLAKSIYEHEVMICDSNGRNLTYKFVVQETETLEIDLRSLRNYMDKRIFEKPMRALQCLEVVLSSPCHNVGLHAGRSYFMKPNNFINLYDGYEMWTGLYQAAILGDQLYLNVDISHKAFANESLVIDYLVDIHNVKDLNTNLDRSTLNGLSTYIKGMSVMYTPPKCFNTAPKIYEVNDVSTQSAMQIEFKNEAGVTLTVEKYFNKRGYLLKYPKLNCLHVGPRAKNIYLPIELCKIPSGQILARKDAPRQVQQLIRHSASSTNERKMKIMDIMLKFSHNKNTLINRFGIEVGKQFIQVPMRVLTPPYIEYYAHERILPVKGVWRLKDKTKLLNIKTKVFKWAIIYSRNGRLKYMCLVDIATKICNSFRRLGLSLGDMPTISAFVNVHDMLKTLKYENYDLVVVVLSTRGNCNYGQVKKNAELKFGVLTQCIKEETILRRCDNQTLENICLKINAKLNGTNHKTVRDSYVDLKNVMFLGADVSHNSPEQRHFPSVVGVVASHDEVGACYNMQYRLQESRVETIEDMLSIFTFHLQVYHKHQGRYPDHVIYYRDGVSDGQFPIVRDRELRGMRDACKKLGISPKIACIIVVKRHHTRFFPKSVGRDKYNNVEPGTVVDQVIVHPNETQFFMVSHQSPQGTAKPTRYNVIANDADLNVNVIQQLTYDLCHMFPRCNRAVSYPAPAYLAHLVASRGGVYLENTLAFSDDIRQEYEKRLIHPAFLEKNPMYFV